MKRPAAAFVAAACCAVAAAAGTAAPPAAGLGTGNFVDVGDTVVDMLDTSGLAFSTLVIGQADASPYRHAAYGAPAPLPLTHPFESRCPGGGSITGSMRDGDASDDVSVQDRFVTVFHACRLDGGVVTGSSEFTVASHRFDGTTEITELDFVFKQLGTDTLRWSGPARVTLRSDSRTGSDHYVVLYRDLAVTRKGHPYRWNFTLEVKHPPLGDDTASINGSMSMRGMTLRLDQEEPFVMAEGAAHDGRLVASDAQGSRLLIEADRGGYAYRLFLHGHRGDVPDAQSHSRPAAAR